MCVYRQVFKHDCPSCVYIDKSLDMFAQHLCLDKSSTVLAQRVYIDMFSKMPAQREYIEQSLNTFA